MNDKCDYFKDDDIDEFVDDELVEFCGDEELVEFCDEFEEEDSCEWSDEWETDNHYSDVLRIKNELASALEYKYKTRYKEFICDEYLWNMKRETYKVPSETTAKNIGHVLATFFDMDKVWATVIDDRMLIALINDFCIYEKDEEKRKKVLKVINPNNRFQVVYDKDYFFIELRNIPNRYSVNGKVKIFLRDGFHYKTKIKNRRIFLQKSTDIFSISHLELRMDFEKYNKKTFEFNNIKVEMNCERVGLSFFVSYFWAEKGLCYRM